MIQPSTLLMVRPASFVYNEQTAGSNSFQNKVDDETNSSIQEKAVAEFDNFVLKLKEAGIDIRVFHDSPSPATPDAIFPNNWISFHDNNTIVLYPMLAPNRRLERRMDIVDAFKNAETTLIYLSVHENKNIFLEGTGSIVFDYSNKIAYANTSPRTDKNLLEELCKQIHYKAISFKAVDNTGSDIYHTNVLMCIGNTFAVICKECIPDQNQANTICKKLETTGHELLTISRAQMNSFAGNMYQAFNAKGESYIIMSEQAFKALNKEQIKTLQQHGTLLHAPLYTIEKYGGGSARCMMADVRNNY